MEEEVNKETSFLGEVLDEEYCTFLEDTDGKKEELEKILYIQDSKKNEIIQSIYDSNTYDENKEIYQKVILKVQDIMDGNIQKLTELVDELKVLNMAVIRLVVDKSTKDKYQTQELTQTIHYVKDKVDEFKESESNLMKSMKRDEKEIISYLRNPYLLEESLIKPINDEQSEDSDEKNEKKNVRRRQGSALVLNTTLDIEDDFDENDTLLISEREKKVYLPYKLSDLDKYITSYPNEYENYQDVVNKEFILPLDIFMKNQTLSRFKETYDLIRNKESKSMIESFRYSSKLMFRYELNPAVIAACKSKNELEQYLTCMQNNNLDDFDCFKIKFDLNLL